MAIDRRIEISPLRQLQRFTVATASQSATMAQQKAQMRDRKARLLLVVSRQMAFADEASAMKRVLVAAHGDVGARHVLLLAADILP